MPFYRRILPLILTLGLIFVTPSQGNAGYNSLPVPARAGTRSQAPADCARNVSDNLVVGGFTFTDPDDYFYKNMFDRVGYGIPLVGSFFYNGYNSGLKSDVKVARCGWESPLFKTEISEFGFIIHEGGNLGEIDGVPDKVEAVVQIPDGETTSVPLSGYGKDPGTTAMVDQLYSDALCNTTFAWPERVHFSSESKGD